MPAGNDVNGKPLEIGDTVNVVCVITAASGPPPVAALTMTTKYPGADGNTDTVTADANQVVKDQ